MPVARRGACYGGFARGRPILACHNEDCQISGRSATAGKIQRGNRVRLLADAETAKYPVENVVGVHGAHDFAELGQGEA